MDVLDVRTPPKIKLQQDKKKYEQSHPGVAIPIDEDSIDLNDPVTKKFNFYKLDRPTTESTISTWILLSGQSASTTKYSTPSTTNRPSDIIVPIYSRTKKPVEVKAPSIINERVKFTEINNIASKKKPTYTTTTTEATNSKSSTSKTTIIKDKNKNIGSTTESISSRPPATMNKTINHKKKITVLPTSSTEYLKKNTEDSTVVPILNNNSIINVNNTTVTNSSTITLESKDGSIVLTNDKKKKASNKKKKNKRRKRPANKANTNIETVNKIKKKTDAISSQIYSYLSREIVPTLGVGLVGLMVTAGLAGYFLYPFGAARRNINVDRNDKENYYYKDEYSGGILEEDAIGQVIAGMPTNSLYPSKSSSTKNPYMNKIYRSNHQSSIQHSKSSENVAALFERNDNKNNIEINENKHTNKVDNSRFVVGGVQKEVIEEVTPAAVPEHGPRSFRSGIDFKNILGIIN
ncbi:uncharacterized protein LOC130453108 [Diorhabda sublineata]|uniref:uncharacterized protein LOC130453108 n=1 Tax=Diorhabda sublineata TaxID=1163346 RepID=UPI0024E191EC|nr:uncharacterized protein LOC130453108 [Diorhabda sublineata]